MSLRLIGAGLGRTGTLSLKLALERLGLAPCYHMAELFMNPTHAALWVRAADGTPDWNALLGQYAATVDYPGCMFWGDLAQAYPSAKVLLSVRDPDKWFDSTQATIFSEHMQAPLRGSPLHEFFAKTVWKDYGDRIHDRDFMVATFKAHNADVERAIPKERLLVYEVSQGWEPLCRFLNVPVPDEPFPRVNSTEEHQQMRAQMHAAGGPFDFETFRSGVRQRLDEMKQR